VNLSGSWEGVPVWTIAAAWLLSCALRGWSKGLWHQLAFPLALLVFVGLRLCPITTLSRVMTGGELFVSLLAFRGWKWLSSDWPQTNDEPALIGRQLLGLGGATVSTLTGLGFIWLMLLAGDAIGQGISSEKLGRIMRDMAIISKADGGEQASRDSVQKPETYHQRY
jgi:hypothetical protein